MQTIEHVLSRKGHEVASLGPDHAVREGLRMMAYQGIGSVVVADDKGLLGILTERDYARKVALLDRTSASTPIGDIMSPAEIIPLNTTIEHAMALMSNSKARHLVVMDGEEIAGVVSMGDLVNAMIQEQAFEIEQLSSYLFSATGRQAA